MDFRSASSWIRVCHKTKTWPTVSGWSANRLHPTAFLAANWYIFVLRLSKVMADYKHQLRSIDSTVAEAAALEEAQASQAGDFLNRCQSLRVGVLSFFWSQLHFVKKCYCNFAKLVLLNLSFHPNTLRPDFDRKTVEIWMQPEVHWNNGPTDFNSLSSRKTFFFWSGTYPTKDF